MTTSSLRRLLVCVRTMVHTFYGEISFTARIFFLYGCAYAYNFRYYYDAVGAILPRPILEYLADIQLQIRSRLLLDFH